MSHYTDTDLLADLRAETTLMVNALETLVRIDSPSTDPDATARCADAVASLARDLLGADPDRVVSDGRTHLLWRFGSECRVLIIGHLDTVWPLGTTERWPFTVEEGVARGPGVFDMKAGIIQGLYALRGLQDLEGVALFIGSDEELGSPTARKLLKHLAASAQSALVLEPSAPGGALKTARKGVASYELVVTGRAAHAGLEPHAGANALSELARQVLKVERLASSESGTDVTPTMATAGTSGNTVPSSALLHIDVRAPTEEEQSRVDHGIRALEPETPGTSLNIRKGYGVPPLPPSASAELFARAVRLADELGIGPLTGAEVGGGSDGNFTAASGCPTLDGLGAVGGGAHAETEHVVVSTMPERAALMAALVGDLLARG
jgi:glutamate carboxypeptidase